MVYCWINIFSETKIKSLQHHLQIGMEEYSTTLPSFCLAHSVWGPCVCGKNRAWQSSHLTQLPCKVNFKLPQMAPPIQQRSCTYWHWPWWLPCSQHPWERFFILENESFGNCMVNSFLFYPTGKMSFQTSTTLASPRKSHQNWSITWKISNLIYSQNVQLNISTGDLGKLALA